MKLTEKLRSLFYRAIFHTLTFIGISVLSYVAMVRTPLLIYENNRQNNAVQLQTNRDYHLNAMRLTSIDNQLSVKQKQLAHPLTQSQWMHYLIQDITSNELHLFRITPIHDQKAYVFEITCSGAYDNLLKLLQRWINSANVIQVMRATLQKHQSVLTVSVYDS